MTLRGPLRRLPQGSPTYRRNLGRTKPEPGPSRTKRPRAAAGGALAAAPNRTGYLTIVRATRKLPYPLMTKEIGAYVGDRRVRLGTHASTSMFQVLSRLPQRNFENHDEFRGVVRRHWNRIQSLATPRQRGYRHVTGRTVKRRGSKVPRGSTRREKTTGPY